MTNLVQFNSFFTIPLFFLKSVGVSPYYDLKKKQRRNYCQIAVFLCSYVNLSLLVLGEIVYFIKTFGNFKNFIEATSVTLCIGYIFLSFAKVGTIVWEKDKMSQLMYELGETFPKTAAMQRAYNVQKYDKQAKFLIRLYSYVQIAMIWLFNFWPLIETIIGYIQNRTWEADFPYIIWYPFNPYAKGFFEINYLSQIWAAYVAAAAMLSTDTLLCGVVELICMHFYDLKQNMLLQLRPTSLNRKWANERLKDCIRKHNFVIRQCEDLDDIFGISILFNFVSSCIIICVLGFLVTTIRSTELFKYVFTLITCVLQIYIVCLMGDKIQTYSADVANAAFQSEWYYGDKSYRQSILLIIQRSQRAKHLTAYKFSVANMVSFSKVLSTSWQFFALLHSVYEQ